MKLLNIVEVESKGRYVPIEIYHGDITNIGFKIDLLITSAFVNSYSPTKNSVFGALKENLSIDIVELSKDKSIDFKSSLNCWFTDKHQSENFKQIMVLEMLNLEKFEEKSIDLDDLFKKMFIAINVLEELGEGVKSIALPVLGTGLERVNLNAVIDNLLQQLKINLKKNTTLERILFVEFNNKKATKLSESLDDILGRAKIEIPVNIIVDNQREEILTSIQKNVSSDLRLSESFQFLKRTFINSKARSVEYGIACRRITEAIITEKYFSESEHLKLSFFLKIKELPNKNVANWIISYIHVIRIFGNEAAHDTTTEFRAPKKIDSKDISLLLFCLLRVVEFWKNDLKKG